LEKKNQKTRILWRVRCGDARLIPTGVEIDAYAARKRFFLKKEAKTFAYWSARWGSFIALRTKVFCFFLRKKEGLAYGWKWRLDCDINSS
jgi:hypothetical protein